MKTSAIFSLLATLQTVAFVHAQDFIAPDSSAKNHCFVHAALERQINKVDSRLSLPPRQAQNPSGDVLEIWRHRYSLWLIAPTDGASAMTSDKFGNIYVTGASSSLLGGHQNTDYATVKYDASGTQQWVARYKSPGNNYDLARAIAVDGSGNVYVTGNSGAHSECDYATVKYNSAGSEQWVNRYDGPRDYSEDYALALAVDATGNVYVTGESGEDYATVKYNCAGTEQWFSRYQGPANSYDVAHALAVDDSGNIYVTGVSGGDYATVKYDSTGTELWVARYNGPGNHDDYATALVIDPVGNVFVTGSSGTIKYDSGGRE
ncbi:MAG: SBBP repeat-containing protein [bacterium]